MSLILWEFSFREEGRGVHSLIYSASPKYVMMILVKSPEAILAKSQERKVGANKDRKHPRRKGILNLLKWQ